ncbi:MAG: hypothetical protein JNL24_05195 [Bacteroidia bacterium]|nr:hypothetical protein [Bacteroidia bacterium]
MDLSNLSSYFNKLDLIKDTADQIIKDFDMFGLEIRFSGNAYNAYEELFEQIEPHIKKLIDSNQSKFMGILYRIDVSDDQIKKALKDNSSESFSEIITDLIIRRELQKVVIRQHYKTKPKQSGSGRKGLGN